MASVYRNKGRSVWMMKYYGQDGTPIRESTGETNKAKAKKIADAKETDKGRGLPVAAGVGKILFGTVSVAADPAKGIAARPATGAVALYETDYRNNEQTSLAEAQRRLRLHLCPVFSQYRMANIGAFEITAYIDLRRAEGAAAATVNRETDALRRMFSLCVEKSLLLYQPKVSSLRERKARSGFFERAAFDAVRAHLPPVLQAVATFAYITGWRVASEVLTRQWRHVDLDEANVVRLDPGETKNGEPRVFPLTTELRALLVERRRERDALAAAGYVCPWVFFRVRGMQKPPRLCWACGQPLQQPAQSQRTCNETCAAESARRRRHAIAAGVAPPPRPMRQAPVGRPEPVKHFRKAWITACRDAGCTGKLVHDFRRTAVRNMVRHRVPERVAMQLSGHLTRAVFERYNIVSEGDLMDAAAALDGLGAAPAAAGTPTGTPEAATGTDGRTTRKKVRKFGEKSGA